MKRLYFICLTIIIPFCCFAQKYNLEVDLSNGCKVIIDANEVDSLYFNKGEMNFVGKSLFAYIDSLENVINGLKENVCNLTQTQSNSNVLYGKKWVACGDSFTEGDFTGDQTGDVRFKEGLYAGQYKVYPYYIGRRNNMIIVNEAKCGSTMAKNPNLSDDADSNRLKSFSIERYKNIPHDADYITLWFGINDAAARALGNLDDETNETFYGAWNIVLRHLITTHPYAKIGIIITNGTSAEPYKQATREVALKWGIPYLDMVKDPGVPVILERDESLGLSAEVSNLRRKSFIVNSNNPHPNQYAHEYESTFIEEFLRRL